MNIDCTSFEKVSISKEESESIKRPNIGYWKDSFIRFKKNKIAMIFLIYVILLILGSILIPIFSSYTISHQNLEKTNLAIGSDKHIFGTDAYGRDIFVRVWYGARISLTIAIAAVLIDIIFGVVYGGIAGYMGGRVDNLLMRFIDIIQAIPFMIFAILLTVVMKPGIITIIVAYSILGWTSMARQVRGLVHQVKTQEYILAARILGASPIRIFTKHIFPNLIGIIIVTMTLTVPSAMFTEAFLSYLGLGVPTPEASWGTLASDGTAQFIVYPEQLLIPAAFISVTMLAFNLIGDTLRDSLDPKLRK